jgi:hypothetical protein
MQCSALLGLNVISLIPQIGIYASTAYYLLSELIHFGFLDAFSNSVLTCVVILHVEQLFNNI